MTDFHDQPKPQEAAPPASTSRNASPRAITINTLSAYATLIAGALVGFVTTPLILHALGTLRYGTFSELGATAAYLGLLELGLGTATTTRTASAEVDGSEALQDVLSTSIALYIAIGVAMLILTGVLTIVLPTLFSIPSHLRHDAAVAFVVLGVAQAASAPVLALSAFLLGTGRMHKLNLLGFAVSTAATVATVGVALTNPSLALLALVQFIGVVASLGLYWWQMRRDFPAVRPRREGARWSTARQLLSLGWRNSITNFFGTLAYGSDLVLIGILLNPRAAAAYVVALKGYALIQRLTTGAVGALGPSHAHRAATATAARRFDLFCVSLLVTLIFALLCGLTVLFYSHALLHLWLGKVPPHSSTVLIIFCFVLIVQGPGNASSAFLVNSELVSRSMRLTVMSALLNVVASVALTIVGGVTGPALGSLIGVSTFDLIFFPRAVCRILGYRYTDILRRTVRPLVLPTIVLVATLVLDRQVARSGIIVLPLAATAGAAYALSLWFTQDVRRLQQRLRRA